MQANLNSNSKIQLADGVAFRYEHNFNGGTVILLDTHNDKLWYANKGALNLIKMLNRKPQTQTITEAFSEILTQYPSEDYEIVLNSLNTIINDLSKNDLIEEIQ